VQDALLQTALDKLENAHTSRKRTAARRTAHRMRTTGSSTAPCRRNSPRRSSRSRARSFSRSRRNG
jgi:hypothetical protein